jgi:uncharacterized membrane protein YjjP (DUF1212 family)
MSMCEVGLPGINAWRLGELEQLARAAEPGVPPYELAARLAAVECTATRFSAIQIAISVGAASSGFCFLNGAGGFELIAAGVGGTAFR